jgi:PucR family transcriptional regulator, purine catabolism regulatory protein
MDTEFVLTVEEVLKRPLFHGARVLAGDSGLHRQVRWVHILEVSNIDKLTHGQELILTTGNAFKSDMAFSVRYLEQLINQGVSCLCIELGHYLDAVPEQMIEVARQHEFPLIVFPGAIRFVDITQDLHSLIINQHHQMLQDLERVSREFHRMTLTSKGTSSVLKLLHSSTTAQVVYLPVQGQPRFIPDMPVRSQTPLLHFLSPVMAEIVENKAKSDDTSPYLLEYEHQTVIIQPAGALGKTWACLVMLLKHKPREYDYLILDAASLSISQDLLRKRYIEERKLYAENLWVDDLLHDRLKDENQIRSLLGTDYKRLNDASYQVCLVELEPLEEQASQHMDEGHESAGIHLSLLLRPIFEQYFFYPLITLKNNKLVVVAIDLNRKLPAKARLGMVFESLQHLHIREKIDSYKLLVGVGKTYEKLIHAHFSYQEAIQSLSLYACFDKPVLFFEELGVFQLLFNINDRDVLHAFVHNYLGPIIEHDQNKGSELLHTLKVFLDHDGSKQIAAQHLYIVRQSLYYRLDKIAELLGPDFMSPDNRIALQVALRAYQLLHT